MKANSLVVMACSLATLVDADEAPRPVDLDHWVLRNPLPTAGALVNVAFAHDVFLAMDYYRDTLWTSTNGTNWTGRWIPSGAVLSSVTYGNETFVAVGGAYYDYFSSGYGRILTSPDAAIWSEPSSGTSVWLGGVTYGAGLFVAVGESGAVLASSDGATWIEYSSGTTQMLHAVTYAQGVFVAVGSSYPLSVGSVVLTSPDGVNWTERYSGTIRLLHQVAFGNGTFVAMGLAEDASGGAVLTSPDGVVWTRQTNPPYPERIGKIVFGNGVFVQRGGEGGHSTLISSDGVAWTEYPTAVYLSRVTFGNGMFVGVNDSWAIFTSPDAVHWTQQGNDAATANVADTSSTSLGTVAFGNGTFVAGGRQAVSGSYALLNIVTSPDGVTWTRRNGVTNAYSFVLSVLRYGGGKFVGVGSLEGSALILTSANGTSWSQWSSGNGTIASRLKDVAYGKGTFVAVGDDTIVTSPDGTNWTEQTSGPYGRLSGVCYGNGLFVAVGCCQETNIEVILSSPDGITWTPRSVDTHGRGGLKSIAYGNGVFVAGGGADFGTRFDFAVAVTSPDGIIWNTAFVGFPSQTNPVINRIFFATGTFVAVSGVLNGGIATSPDGAAWRLRKRGYPGTRVYDVAFGNGSFIAVGGSGVILQSGTLPQLQPEALQRLGDGTMRVVLEAGMGAELLLEASVNLVDWARLATLTNTLGAVSYFDLPAPNFGHRFYRARQIST